VVVTRNAVAVGANADVDVAQAPVWGMVRAAQAENPGRFVLLDIDKLDDASWFVAGAVSSGEPEIAVRELQMRVPRLVRASMPEPAGDLDPNGTVLITGGTGGLGAVVARHLIAERGARHLVLASRRGESAPGAVQLRDELTALGATVTVAACDVADRGAVAALVAAIPAGHPLTTVVHAAGVGDSGLISSLGPDRWEKVLAAKADSAWYLHELTRDLPLSAFVLFSSTGGLVQTAGQANYAAANVFLDALAQHRAAEGLPATAMAFGLWTGAGAGQWLGEVDLLRMRRQGLPALSLADGLRGFDTAFAAAQPALVTARIDVAALRSRTDEVPALLRGMIPASRRITRSIAGGFDADGLKRQLAGLDAANAERVLVDLVRTYAAGVLGHPSADDVQADQSFQELGFDSLSGVELRNQLNAATGLRLPATMVFDYPSAQAVAGHLRAELQGETEPANPALGEIDRLEAVLTGVPRESQDSELITSRLQLLLRRWMGAETVRHESVENRIGSGSAEDVLAFIQNDLGIT
jgi:NAD(P)-dependent dehydrogenase (short-subunit alcohol dehydrogenase family)/acyl carrier protein